jgi:hypothetical protein
MDDRIITSLTPITSFSGLHWHVPIDEWGLHASSQSKQDNAINQVILCCNYVLLTSRH